jgi:hypothetical protein
MKLEVWQRSVELYKLIWKTAYVEVKLDYKLRAQLADAAQSISSKVENKLIRLVESLEAKREDGSWINRLADDSEDYGRG